MDGPQLGNHAIASTTQHLLRRLHRNRQARKAIARHETEVELREQIKTLPPWMPETLSRFPEANVELLERRALQKRVDTKFILDFDALRQVLGQVRDHYGLLTAEGASAAQYKTLYFDTPNYDCLREHHRGRRPRHKIRIRHYLDRKLSYLEIKNKTSANRTIKARQEIPFLQESIGSTERDFINQHNPIAAESLRPSLRTDFHRITLVGLDTMERATFDLDLSFQESSRDARIPGAVIAEIKQDRFRARSPIMLALRQAHVLPESISKYCTAATLLLPSLPMQRYLPKIRSLRRMLHD